MKNYKSYIIPRFVQDKVAESSKTLEALSGELDLLTEKLASDIKAIEAQYGPIVREASEKYLTQRDAILKEVQATKENLTKTVCAALAIPCDLEANAYAVEQSYIKEHGIAFVTVIPTSENEEAKTETPEIDPALLPPPGVRFN